MSKNKFELPTFDDVLESIHDGHDTPLDDFIYDFEPLEDKACQEFREQLESAIQYVIENVESFGLTLDGAVKSIHEPLSQTICAIHKTPYSDRYGCEKCNAARS